MNIVSSIKVMLNNNNSSINFINYYFCRIKGQITYWALEFVQECGWSEEKQIVKNGLGSGFNE